MSKVVCIVISDLEIGDKVRVEFDEPVAESYPLQGTAGIIWVVED